MSAPSMQVLKAAFNTVNPALQPLRDGAARVRGIDMDQVDSKNIIAVFRHQCRTLEYDISEMAVVTYFTMRHYGMPVTAIPVFPSSRVDQGNGILVNQQSSIKAAKDFEGKRVGMRSFAVTPCTWQKAYLQAQGVDLDRVRWFCADDEHVEALNADMPPAIEYQKGADAAQMLRDGQLDATLGIIVNDAPNVVPLVPDARQRGIEQFKRDGVYHLIHLMTVKNTVLEANPGLLEATYNAFKESRTQYLASLGEKAPQEKWDDPLPLGLDETRASLELLMKHAVDQKILPAPMNIDELFPGNFN